MAKITDLMFYIPKEKFNFVNLIKLLRTKYKEYNEILFNFIENPSEYCLKFITIDNLNYTCNGIYNNITFSIEYGHNHKFSYYEINMRYNFKIHNTDLKYNKFNNKFIPISITNKFNLRAEYTTQTELNNEFKKIDNYINIFKDIDNILLDDKNKILLSYCDSDISYDTFIRVFSYYNKFNIDTDLTINEINNFIEFINEIYDPKEDICNVKYSNLSLKLKNGVSFNLCGKLIFNITNVNIYKYINIDTYPNELKFIIKLLSNLNIYDKLIINKQKYLFANI